MMKNKSIALALLALWLGLVGCDHPKSQSLPPPKVNVVQPVPREVTEWDDYTARLDAVESVEVRPRVSGYLQSIHFKDGAIVKKGELLFLIDPRPYEASLRHAEADLALVRSRLALAQSCASPCLVHRSLRSATAIRTGAIPDGKRC